MKADPRILMLILVIARVNSFAPTFQKYHLQQSSTRLFVSTTKERALSKGIVDFRLYIRVVSRGI
jgi:hypothetical protein